MPTPYILQGAALVFTQADSDREVHPDHHASGNNRDQTVSAFRVSGRAVGSGTGKGKPRGRDRRRRAGSTGARFTPRKHRSGSAACRVVSRHGVTTPRHGAAGRRTKTYLSAKSPMSRSAAAVRDVTPVRSLTAASRARTSRQEIPSWTKNTVKLVRND